SSDAHRQPPRVGAGRADTAPRRMPWSTSGKMPLGRTAGGSHQARQQEQNPVLRRVCMSSNPEGLRTLETLEEAPNYNAWLASRFKEHLGQRVLEVGAGIGTISSQIHQDRELLVALEMEHAYVARMQE